MNCIFMVITHSLAMLGVHVLVVTFSLHEVFEGLITFLTGVWQVVCMYFHVVFQVPYVNGLIGTVLFRAFVYCTVVGFHMCVELRLSHVFPVTSDDVALEHGFCLMFDQVCP